MRVSRRDFLSKSAILAASASASGCANLVQPISQICANDPAISDPSSPLTIDVHAHVFNGTDLQAKAFLSRIMHIPGVGSILQELALEDAPTAMRELEVLANISGGEGNCDQSSFITRKNQHREEQYQRGRAALQAAASKVDRRGFLTDAATSATIRKIGALEETHAAYRKRKFQRNARQRLAPAELSVDGAIDFILRNFQYRYVNVFDYLEEYSRGRARKVDLIIAHLVDFDWPIGDGCETISPIPDQIQVMSKISALTNGRVHCYAPFDPLKQVAYELGGFRYSPLDIVSRAIQENGFIGVKLYPPMGFRPYGNADLASNFWDRDWIPPLLRRADTGKRLDQALSALYEWCRRPGNDAPIMAHTAPSNGPDKAFLRLTDPSCWESTVAAFPGLRVNFGHFGDTQEVESDNPRRPLRFAHMMNQSETGRLLYADSAFFVDILGNQAQLTEKLRACRQLGVAPWTCSHSESAAR
ncbi:MAG TPA: twin-arginine translocation signal domain-containing protein [Methylocystis sp.]|nr:twin-arginine translocation signal domain-containing protein [Methylocystis sp.]